MSELDLQKLLPFYGELSQSERASVERAVQVRSYERGSIVHSREHECLGFIRVQKGSVRSYMLSEEGREITLYELNEGDCDVLSAACVVSQITFETQLVATSDCEILVLPASCLSKLKDDNVYVRCFIFEKLGERFSDAMYVMQDMLFVPLERRLAELLLYESKHGKNAVHSTHEEIAIKLNSSREVISRCLNRMKQAGIVELKRQSIQVLDADRLAQL